MRICDTPEDCDDSSECTEDACDVNGQCINAAVEDGTMCGDGAGSCQAGSCVGTFPCTEQGIRDAIAVGDGPHTFDCEGPKTIVTEAEIGITNEGSKNYLRRVILDGEGNLTVDGDASHRVFSVGNTVAAELRGFVVRNGAPSSGDGGGIHNEGWLTVMNSTVSGNTAARGGGIWNYFVLTLTNTTVSGNTATVAGGGIANGDFFFPAMATLIGSTVSENNAESRGGGINNEGGLSLTDSTVSGNGINNTRGLTLTNSTVSGGGITSSGIVPSPSVTLIASTVSGSISHFGGRLNLINSLIDGNCNGIAASSGYNIESPGNTCGLDEAKGDQINVTEEQLNLGKLADNGGPTMTHKPGDGGFGNGSAAIDQIPVADCVDADGEPLITDQRGLPRPVAILGPEPKCDVGSVEVQP